MDVPFISSGAMSRAHYALVRNVENAASPQAADHILLNELDVIRRNLQQPHLSIKDCKECLILILHCTMSLSTASPGDLEFAFPHAVNLAELGKSPLDKKIGYMFCVELMPPNHELQLMLVNTLRKASDLESSSVARICLALDVLIQVPNEDVIPAVDTRLQTLVEHPSVAVRRRGLMAYYTLFQRDAERLARLEDVIQRRLWPEHSGIELTFTTAGKVCRSQCASHLTLPSGFHIVRLESGSVPVVFDIIKRVSKVPIRGKSIYIMVTSTEHSTAVLRDSFMLLSTVSTEALRESQLSSIAITSIRHFLSSRDPNDVFLFVSCLSSLDPSIWAGTHPNTAPLLDEWEVQGVMRLLDSPDGLIRKTTLKILHSVDPTIVETYYSQALHNLSPSHSLSGKNEYVLRLLEIIDMQEANDVDQYARRLRELFSVVEGGEHGPTEDLPVLDHSVERILNGIRERETSSRISCVTALAVSLTEPEVRVGPTIMVVISALVSEYCGKVSISPLEMLRGIATRLAFYAPSVQDACLLTMLRLSVECDEVPEQVTVAVHQLSQHASTYLRRRCDQFLSLSTQRRVLAEIISGAPSPSLPDFLFALTRYQSNPKATPPQSPRTISSGRQDLLEFSPSRGTVSARRLRYEAYAAPQPVPSLRYLSSPRRSKGSVSSPEGSTRSLSRASNASNSLNELAKTITPGELTLAAAQSPFYALEVRITRMVPRPVAQTEIERQNTRTFDLIALDSPFIAEPAKEESTDADFKAAWESMENANVRGWCEASLDMIVRLLQSLQYRMRVIATDQPPFEGELKVLVQGPEPQQYATLRLREGEDESCLWRLRCDDLDLRTSIKRLMEDI
ncbi:ARM repeat-containing protein [Imleria badia]|nr:ARM repeat-containing protein [Imleria badia]